MRYFLEKIYTAGKKFTQPPVVTVATNFKSVFSELNRGLLENVRIEHHNNIDSKINHEVGEPRKTIVLSALFRKTFVK